MLLLGIPVMTGTGFQGMGAQTNAKQSPASTVQEMLPQHQYAQQFVGMERSCPGTKIVMTGLLGF